jgi:hypothetical protein
MSRIHAAHHLALVAGALALLAHAAVACGDDDDGDADTVAEVEEVARTTFESDGSNADYVFEHVTDNIIETVFFSSREECMANPVECIGEPASILSMSGTAVDGDHASTNVLSDFGVFRIDLVREGGTWKVDALLAGSDDVPEGATIVDLSLVDFSFGFERADIPAGGNFAFRATNSGQQTHEVVVLNIPDGSTLEEAVEAVGNEEVPPLVFKVFIRPGQEDVDVAFESPLPPGKYALVCFFPDTSDPTFAAHIEKGMVAEFEVE